MFEDIIYSAGGEVFEVGGTVRDRLQGLPHKDKDYLVTGVPLEKLSELLRAKGAVTFVGKSFGVLKFSPFNEPGVIIDIAIPRKEVSTGSGHRDFEVEYDHTLPVEIDLSRRDFTINAIAWNVKKNVIIDPFNGREDLQKKVLRQVFAQAFVEDPLRLLRAVQFAARFELEVEEQTFLSMKEHSGLIATVSSERIIEEIKKLFLASKPSEGFKIMAESGLLEKIFPEVFALIGIMQDKGHDAYQHTMIVLDATASDKEVQNKGDIELMLAALFHDVGKARTARFVPTAGRVAFFGHQIVSKRLAAKWLNKMKATNIGIEPSNVLKLIENHMFETKSFFSDKAIRRFIAKVGKELILKLLDLRLADNRGGKYPGGIGGVIKLRKRIIEELERKPPFGPKDLAVNGHDLMQIGIPASRKMGEIIKQLVEIVLDEPELNVKEGLLEKARGLYEKEEEKKEPQKK